MYMNELIPLMYAIVHPIIFLYFPSTSTRLIFYMHSNKMKWLQEVYCSDQDKHILNVKVTVLIQEYEVIQ